MINLLIYLFGPHRPASPYPPKIMFGAALLVTCALLARRVMARQSRQTSMVYVIVSGIGAAAALTWIWVRPATLPDPYNWLGFVSFVCTAVAAWMLLLPADYDLFEARVFGRRSDSPEQHLRDAFLLLSFLRGQGRIGDPDGPGRIGDQKFGEVLEALRAAEAKIMADPPQQLTTAEEKDFSRALALLIATAAPVTVESLREEDGLEPTQRSAGEKKLALHGRCMIVAVCLLVLFQAYTAVGLSLQAMLVESKDRYLGLFGFVERRQSPQRPVGRYPADPKAELQMAQTEFYSLQSMLETWVKPIAGTLLVLGFEYKPPQMELAPAANGGTENSASQTPLQPKMPPDYDKLRTQVQLLLDFMNTYLLPLLYGWAGASVYVVRRITRELSEHSYRNGATNYVVRLSLGAIAGLAIGWFQQKTVGTSVPLTGATQLTPLALAFLAGFGVEIFFTLLDRMLQVASDPKSVTPPTGR